MASENIIDIKKLSTAELQKHREEVEKQRADLLLIQKELSNEIKDRLAREQIATRYGAAGVMLLEFMTPQEFTAKRAQLVAEGKIKELTTVVKTNSAETTVGIEPIKNVD